MLRKLFPQAANSEGPAVGKADPQDWDEVTGYSNAVAELDHFEGRLKDLLRTLTRHCQVLTEVSASTGILYDQMNGLLLNVKSSDVSRPESDEAVGLVNMFRVSAIAPLQHLLIAVPQLRIRCDHRRSALQLMLRYQQKVTEMERANKLKTESNRLLRNRAKLHSATTRFKEMDAHVQSEIKTLVAKDITKVVASSVNELLLRAQRLVGEMMIESAARWQTSEAPQPPQQPEDDTRDNEKETTPEEQPQEQKPQRRMAMIVVPEVTESGVYVRQSILAPPVAVAASMRQPPGIERRPSTTTTEGVDQETQGDSEHEAGPEIHEDYGIGKRKKHAQGTRPWDIHRQIKDSLATEIELAECVRLPDGYERDEWIAVHVIDFYNEINLLYGTISEFCTAESCPKMSAGPCYTYMWADTIAQLHQVAPPCNLPAPMYVAKLMNWIESEINNPRIFPPDGTTYDQDFETEVAAVILKRLFRVYAHMYHSHLEHFGELSAESHLGFCFKRFILFINEFKLVDQKELNALRKLVQSVVEESRDGC